MQVIDVKVDDVEILCVAEQQIQHADVMSQLIDAILVQPQRAAASGNQAGAGDGIAAGK